MLIDGHDAVNLLFTDVNMPGEMNGIDLAKHLKRLRPALHLMITSALPALRPVEHMPALFVASLTDRPHLSRGPRANGGLSRSSHARTRRPDQIIF